MTARSGRPFMPCHVVDQCRIGAGCRLRLCSRQRRAARRSGSNLLAARRAGPARPIASRIMRYAICLREASPNGANCRKSKRWPRRSAARAGVRRGAAPPPLAATFGADFAGSFAPKLFMNCSKWRGECASRSMNRAVKRARGLPQARTRRPPERAQHGPIERLDRAIADAQGNAARPYRAVDTLAIMERRGSITAGMRQAGEDFRARFAIAQLDPLRALDLSHLRLGEPVRHGARRRARVCGSRQRATRFGARSRLLAASPRRPDHASGMCSAGSARSRHGRSSRAGTAAASARKPLPEFWSPRSARWKRISAVVV